jgi:predicted naringenin-chalcone synthase
MINQPIKILSAAKQLPPFSRTTEDILPYIEKWLEGQPQRFKDKVLRIFKYAEVDRRYGIMDIDEVFQETSFEEKNDFFIEKSIELSEGALRKALDQAGLLPEDLDIIITVSCTGFMIPSVDAHLINRLRLRQDIIRLPVTEMGCAAGVSGIIYAYRLLQANPGQRAAVIAVESPTSTFQHRDYTMTNMVSAAIFGDGAACAILGPSDKTLPAIRDVDMYHFYDEIDMMGFRLRNTGLQMVLDPHVPDKIEKHFGQILLPFLERNNCTPDDIDHFVFHPGGKKIVKITEELLHAMGKNIDITREVLRNYGNMSSATVLYVLEEYLQKSINTGEKGLMLSFGPGFSAQRVLLEWI